MDEDVSGDGGAVTLADLANRLDVVDQTDVMRALRLSPEALKARLRGDRAFDASQLLIAASLTGLRARHLLEFALRGVD